MSYAKDERRPPARMPQAGDKVGVSVQVGDELVYFPPLIVGAYPHQANEASTGRTAREIALAFELLDRVHREAILDRDLAEEIGALLTRK